MTAAWAMQLTCSRQNSDTAGGIHSGMNVRSWITGNNNAIMDKLGEWEWRPGPSNGIQTVSAGRTLSF